MGVMVATDLTYVVYAKPANHKADRQHIGMQKCTHQVISKKWEICMSLMDVLVMVSTAMVKCHD